MSRLRKILEKLTGVDNLKRSIQNRLANDWFLRPYFSKEQRERILLDPVRYGCFLLALEQIEKENISGSFAECGVYKGYLSKFIHDTSPDRKLYLFDTFQGFDNRDLDSIDNDDVRFKDTSEESVLNYIGNKKNIIVKKGFFPESANGILEEQFSLVIIDFDKYKPTVAALEYFYPLLNCGGFIFVHDYSSPESDWACSKALDEFLIGKPEKAILIPDAWGSAIFRKI